MGCVFSLISSFDLTKLVRSDGDIHEAVRAWMSDPEKAEKKYVEARALDKLRIDQIIAENADDREKENQKYLIDEIRLGLCLNYAVFIYEI